MADYWRDEDFANAEQKKLFDLLRDERGEDFAACYHCCLKVLSGFEHPERLHVAAYALRELMDKLSMKPSKETMGDRVKNLKGEWKSLVQGNKGAGLAGVGESVKDKFLEKCGEFFLWVKNERKSRRERMEISLKDLEPGMSPLPSQLIKPRAKKLLDISEHVNAVLHHWNRETNEAEFRSVLEDFENLLLSNLRPKTFEKQKRFDAIIQRAEQR